MRCSQTRGPAGAARGGRGSPARERAAGGKHARDKDVP